MSRQGQRFIPAALAVLLACMPALAAVLVVDAQPRAILVLPAQPSTNEKLAAQELQSHISMISGVELAILTQGQDAQGLTPILLGKAADAGLDDLIKAKGHDEGAFALVVEPRRLALRGLGDEGTLFAAYELLEQLGVRWYMPGELGTVIPQAKTLSVKEQSTVQVPSFSARWYGGPADWCRRQRMGGPYFPGAHGLPLGPEGTFEKHPEFYSLIDGKRTPAQHCLSNNQMLQAVVAQVKDYFKKNPQAPWVGMGPNDGSGFCECEACRALDGGEWDAFSSEPSMTDRYLGFFNQVLAGIEDEYPDKKICFYAYHTYMRPPIKTKPNPRICPALAPITLCRVHGPSNPLCPEKQYYAWLAREWSKALPEVYDRGYFFNLADPGFPFGMVHRMRDQIPLFKKLGIKGWRVETMQHWVSETPSLYLAGRLMWNVDADVDAILADFTDRFFGPAAKPMSQYLTLMDAALRDGEYHTGCSFNLPDFYPASLREKAAKLLAKAQGEAGKQGIYRRRVDLFKSGFDYLQAFLAMLDHRTTCDFVAAKADMDRLLEIQKQLLAGDPPMISKISAPVYFQRFFAACTQQGYERITGGNRLVARLDDQWQFFLDPTRVGEELNLFRSDILGGEWQNLKTSTRSWSDQGLRYYKGEAWYRQSVMIPASFKDTRVFLWFGGVDEKAKVYLNGQELGVSHSSAYIPFEFDATPALLPGQENKVVVRVINKVLDELGTGGIMAPVMFYAPAAGKDAKVQNAVELGRTFP